MFLNSIQLIRPKQWTKNLILFAALTFSGHLLDLPLFILVVQGFLIFCLYSSCVYIVNDLADREKDRLHPQKKNRPIASGKISVLSALGLFLLLFAISLVTGIMINPRFALMGLLYFILMLLYTFLLKKIMIVDILTIAAGFVIRAIAGAELIGVVISSWLLLCTTMLALFLGLQKRKSELISQNEETVGSTRQSLQSYTLDFINDMLHVVTSCTVMSYCLYCITEHPQLLLTIPAVLYGIFRYQYLSNTQFNATETPELILLKDRPIQAAVLIWILICIAILYGQNLISS